MLIGRSLVFNDKGPTVLERAQAIVFSLCDVFNNFPFGNYAYAHEEDHHGKP